MILNTDVPPTRPLRAALLTRDFGRRQSSIYLLRARRRK